MDGPISRRSSSIRSSEIREILKLTLKPEIISFASGLPNPEAFPHTELLKISDYLLRENHNSCPARISGAWAVDPKSR